MSSNINPGSIDTDYPIAGQDNDSQGFRDNFTNTKTNFEYAFNEITDLQAKSVLTSALVNGVDTDTQNNMNGTKITSALMQDVRGVAYDGWAGDVDVSAGSYYRTTEIPVSVVSFPLNFKNFPKTSSPESLGRVIVEFFVGSRSTPLIVTLPDHTKGKTNLDHINGDNLQLPEGEYIYEFMSIDGNESHLVVTQIVAEAT